MQLCMYVNTCKITARVSHSIWEPGFRLEHSKQWNEKLSRHVDPNKTLAKGLYSGLSLIEVNQAAALKMVKYRRPFILYIELAWEKSNIAYDNIFHSPVCFALACLDKRVFAELFPGEGGDQNNSLSQDALHLMHLLHWTGVVLFRLCDVMPVAPLVIITDFV